MPGELTLIINPDGSIRKQVDGIEGPACMDSLLSKVIDRTFGTPVTHEKTSAYYSQGTSHHVDSRG